MIIMFALTHIGLVQCIFMIMATHHMRLAVPVTVMHTDDIYDKECGWNDIDTQQYQQSTYCTGHCVIWWLQSATWKEW